LRETTARGVEGLVHRREIRRVQALEADEHALAAAAHEQVEELLVVRRIDARLADPADAERRQRTEEIFRLREVRRDVVVHEKEELLAAPDRRRFPRLISSAGRRVCDEEKTVCTAQKSHLKWQPRPASTRPIGR
jgi:hypothetical protein